MKTQFDEKFNLDVQETYWWWDRSPARQDDCSMKLPQSFGAVKGSSSLSAMGLQTSFKLE